MVTSALRVTVVLAALTATVSGVAETTAFKQITRRMEAQYQQKPVGRGFLGLLMRCCSPAGTHGLRMAVFEALDPQRQFAPEVLDGLVRRAAGEDQAPLVYARDRQGHTTYVYVLEADRKPQLLIVSAEPGEAMVMTMRIDPNDLQRWLLDPEGMAHKHGGGAAEPSCQ